MEIVNRILGRALAASFLLLACTTVVGADQDDPPPTNRYVQAPEAIETVSNRNVSLDEILRRGRKTPEDRDRLPMERPRGSDLEVLKGQDCGCQ